MYEYFRGSINPKNVIDTFKFNIDFKRSHPDYFELDGLLTFCGPQGSGKTLSAVNYIKKVLKDYPKCVLVTNIEIKGLDKSIKVVRYSSLNELIKLFDKVSNGEQGVIYFIDEIQVLFNALLKRGMNVETLEIISQQRKQRKHIIGTAQIFMKIDKVFREQMKNVVICNKYLSFIQYNQLIDGFSSEEKDGKLKYNIKKRFVWFHSPKLYEAYDTSAIISAYKSEYENVVFDFSSIENIIKGVKNNEE